MKETTELWTRKAVSRRRKTKWLTCVGRTEQTSYTKHETRIESHAESIGHRIIFYAHAHGNIRVTNRTTDTKSYTVADPGGVQGVQTPAILFWVPFLKRTYFENMSLRFLAEQGAS